MFVDEVKVFARAGHGGKGCVAFQREAYRPKGGPSGGNGGRGGDVILQADHDINNLINQFYQPRLMAQDGQGGLGKGMDGHAGADLVVKVPVGTLVWKISGEPGSLSIKRLIEGDEDGEILAPGHHAVSRTEGRGTAPGEQAKGELAADLTQPGQRFVLCKGGRGGLGNRNFATARRQAPRFAQPGEPGKEGAFLLELRMMAEVGLVGYPNAGKSTLLKAISRARPKIAPYPFTTLHPQIGIVEYPDYYRLTVCDVPGLIEGAHRNVGLGHAFLRHIERCKILVLLVDLAAMDGRAPWEDYGHLLEELELYDPALIKRPRLVVGNKTDEPAAAKNLKEFKRRIGKIPVLPIAAAFDVGTEKFKQWIRKAVEATKTSESQRITA